MKIVSYTKTNEDPKSGVIGGGGSGSSSEIQNPSGTRSELSRTIWGQYDEGDDIDGTATVNGNIYVKVIGEKNYDDDDDDSDGNYIDEEEGGGNLYVDLETQTKTLVVEEDAYVKRHLYINYPAENHPESNKKCIGDLFSKVELDISTNKGNIKKNADEISGLKTRMTNAEKQIEINSTNIDLNEIAIKNNADEIVALKNRTTANETAIANYLPIGAIIMFSGTVAEIPDGWAICNGENGTPNLIGKFIKAWSTAGQTGGGNSVTLTAGNIPKMQLHKDVAKINADDDWKERLNKKIPTLDKIGERVIDKGGSTHWCLDTGTNQGDNGLLGVNYTTVFDDVADYTYIGSATPTAVDFEPAYYTLIYIMRVS